MMVTMLNDCAYVGWDLTRALRRIGGVEIRYLPRGRSVAGKTIKVLLNVLRSQGIIHVHYALQDAWLASKIRHLDVLHVHGSDVRHALHGRWGHLVRHNLQVAKVILCATPDLPELVEPYRGPFQEVLYFPTPVDTDFFVEASRNHDRPRALYFEKSFGAPPDLLWALLKGAGFEVDRIVGRPFRYADMPRVFEHYDVFIDQFYRGNSKTALEAMATGLPVINVDAKQDLAETVARLADPKIRRREGADQRRWVVLNHNVRMLADRLMGIYRRLDSKGP